jgi:type I restriction enzyme S subunit
LQQKQVADKLNALHAETQRLEAIYQQKLAALNELKQSILQKAFSGKLTAEVGDRAVEGLGAMEAA